MALFFRACLVCCLAGLALVARANPGIEQWTTANGAAVYFVAAPEIPMLHWTTS